MDVITNQALGNGGRFEREIMKAHVSPVTSAASGFGQYQRGEAWTVDGDWESVEEYAENVARTNGLIRCYAIDPEVAAMGDVDGEELAAALREANRSVIGGHDTLVAYHLGRDTFGQPNILLESVELKND